VSTGALGWQGGDRLILTAEAGVLLIRREDQVSGYGPMCRRPPGEGMPGSSPCIHCRA
jgi:hypothetical protein